MICIFLLLYTLWHPLARDFSLRKTVLFLFLQQFRFDFSFSYHTYVLA